MSDLSSSDAIGPGAWLKKVDGRLRRMEGSIGRSRIPRLCTSALRPNPAVMQPGVRLFETDTNRSIFVNASQSGFVDSAGTAV